MQNHQPMIERRPTVPRLWRPPPGCSRSRPGAGRAPSRGCSARAESARSSAVAAHTAFRDRRFRRHRRQAKIGAEVGVLLTRRSMVKNFCNRHLGHSHSSPLDGRSHGYHNVCNFFNMAAALEWIGTFCFSRLLSLCAAPPPPPRQIPNARRRIVFLTRSPGERVAGLSRLPHPRRPRPLLRSPPTRNIKAGSMLTAPDVRSN